MTGMAQNAMNQTGFNFQVSKLCVWYWYGERAKLKKVTCTLL